jgi:hypothetical protein
VNQAEIQQLPLQEANRLVARLGGYLGRRGDGEPGVESVGIGLRRLSDLCWGWMLRGDLLLQTCV